MDEEGHILTDIEKAELKHFFLHTTEVTSSSMHIELREEIFLAHQ